MRFRNSNIIYNRILNKDIVDTNYEVATYGGIVRKSLFYLMLVVIGAVGGIGLGYVNPEFYMVLLGIAAVSTFIFAIISAFSPRAVKVTGSIYCLLEGVLVGFISMVYNAVAGGAIISALLGVMLVFTVVTTLFLTNIVKVSSKFSRFLVVFAISFIVCQLLLYLFMTLTGTEYSMNLCLLVSGITIFLATLYLLFDLEHIRQVVEGGYPQEYEWYASYGLVFTLVWLYVEILRIFAIIFSDRS